MTKHNPHPTNRTKLKIILVIIWMLFTSSLAIWLYIFSIHQIDQLSALNTAASENFIRYHRMLIWEGAFLVLCLLGGGLALVYFIFHDFKQNERIKAFFLTFSHEIKTPLTSLQLQAEALLEDSTDDEQKKALSSLFSETGRLSLYLENSLYLAEGSERTFYLEDIDFEELINSISNSFPDLNFNLTQNAIIHSDRRAIESICRNLFLNSQLHGSAKLITISTSQTLSNKILCRIVDDGKGSSIPRDRLGKLFASSADSNSTGIGLYLVQKLASQIQASVKFPACEHGFVVELEAIGHLA